MIESARGGEVVYLPKCTGGPETTFVCLRLCVFLRASKTDCECGWVTHEGEGAIVGVHYKDILNHQCLCVIKSD